jgi:hypothetical protein
MFPPGLRDGGRNQAYFAALPLDFPVIPGIDSHGSFCQTILSPRNADLATSSGAASPLIF